jgi:hypothetical protein
VLHPDVAARLRDALAAERDAVDGVQRARAATREALVAALRGGASYNEVARVTGTCRLGRAPRPDERVREIERLKKCRNSGNRVPHVSTGAASNAANPAVGSASEVSDMSRLIKRVVTEEYGPGSDDEDRDEKNCADDEDERAEADDDQDETESDEE